MYKNIRYNSSAGVSVILYAEMVSVVRNELADHINR